MPRVTYEDTQILRRLVFLSKYLLLPYTTCFSANPPPPYLFLSSCDREPKSVTLNRVLSYRVLSYFLGIVVLPCWALFAYPP